MSNVSAFIGLRKIKVKPKDKEIEHLKSYLSQVLLYIIQYTKSSVVTIIINSF